MVEKQFSEREQFAAVLLLPKAHRTRIQIKWNEGVVKSVRIRHRLVMMATNECGISLESGFREQLNASIALDTEGRIIFDATPERRAL